MRVIDLENITNAMRHELQFVLRCEEVYHDKVSAAAGAILSAVPKRPYVCLTGPSGSGKTTTALRLKAYLENLGAEVCMLGMDNFFLNADLRPEEAKKDWESPLCVNWDLLTDCIDSLTAGKETKVPWFDFKNNATGGYRTMQTGQDSIILIEGIHMLNPLIFDQIRDRATGVYVAPRTRVLTNDDRILRPEQIRVARRMIRDFHGRGKTLRETVIRAESVDRGEVQHIAPYKCNADVHIDTFHDYELCFLASFLLDMPEFDRDLVDSFAAEHGLEVLVQVLRNIPPLTTPYVPKDSLLREFVGGSRFDY